MGFEWGWVVLIGKEKIKIFEFEGVEEFKGLCLLCGDV